MEKGVIIARREDILDDPNDIASVTNDIVTMINNENNIETLKKWLKVSARVNSLEEFIEKIK